MNVNDRVSVFDPRKYVDDRTTPLSITMCPATILRLHEDDDGTALVDVRFDHDGRESKGHFDWGVWPLSTSEGEKICEN